MNLERDDLPLDFDPKAYLELNPDVEAARVDPEEHYRVFGKEEGRVYIRKEEPQDTYDFDGLTSIHNHEFMAEPSFQKAYARAVQAADGQDYQWYWRVHIALWAAKVASRLEGDFVECGVNKGCLSSAIMEYLDWGRQDKTFYLLDTFAGIDQRFLSESELEEGALDKNRRHLSSNFYTQSIDSVRQNFSEWEKNTEIVQGSIPETLQKVSSRKIAFLHIDLNCSLPEVAALDYFWDKLVQGAPVVLDDYAYHGYRSQKLGMDDFAKKKNVAIASLPTGQGLILTPP